MKVVLVVFFTVALVNGQNTVEEAIVQVFGSSGTDFLDNYEEVTPKPLESLGALPKCGEVQQGMICVPYYSCDARTNTTVPDYQITAPNKIDIRQRIDAGSCDHFLDVCCKLRTSTGSDTRPTERPTERPTVRPTDSQTGGSSVGRPEDTTDMIRNPTDQFNTKGNNCGIRNAGGVGFTITGNNDNEAEFGEFPWMIAVLKKTYNALAGENVAICGGSLITPVVVLTGAHCVVGYKEGQIKIRAGEWDTQTEKEPIQYQERDVLKIITHDQFGPKNLQNDVALLILDRPLIKTDSVGTVCLPPSNMRFGGKCFATGWGKDVFGQDGRYSVILKKILLPLVDFNDCQNRLRSTRLGKSFNLHNSFTCAGGEPGKDTCTGDGGSPLVCQDPNNPARYHQVGIVAWGVGCGEFGLPGVYVNVGQFRNWIDSKLDQLQLSKDSYTI